jgi:hypothetical protein
MESAANIQASLELSQDHKFLERYDILDTLPRFLLGYKIDPIPSESRALGRKALSQQSGQPSDKAFLLTNESLDVVVLVDGNQLYGSPG